MDYVGLGTTGLQVSRICLGCMSFDDLERGQHPWSMPEERSRPFLEKALATGITLFDTANACSDGSSEKIVGRVLKDFARESTGQGEADQGLGPRSQFLAVRVRS